MRVRGEGPIPERIWAKIKEADGDSCWIWEGALGARGRPFASFEGKSYYVHIKMYQALVGEIAPGLILRHTCDNILCVSPAHLVPGTRKENLHDSYNRSSTRKKLPQNEVDRLRKGEISVAELARKYAVTVKYLYSVKQEHKRNIRWAT